MTLFHGDCLDVLAELPDASVDSVVCDPPYGLANTTPEQVADTLVRWVNGDRDYLPEGGAGFMGKAWDAFVPPVAVWDECLRVLKPGGHLLAFAGSRTHDLMALGIRLAGFDIRDSIAWLYGSGFPKSLDVSKAIDKAAGATREVVGRTATPFKVDAAASRGTSLQGSVNGDFSRQVDETGYRYTEHTAPATPAAQQWQGWGTALKPAFEPIVVARRPLSGTVAANVLAHGTGALNIDGCRVGGAWENRSAGKGAGRETANAAGPAYGKGLGGVVATPHDAGRWPTNVLLDGDAADELDRQAPNTGAAAPASGPTLNNPTGPSVAYGARNGLDRPPAFHGDSGGASRFFPVFRYQAKAPTRERVKVDGIAHPTVKPLALMRWLVRLVTPPGGVVLEPFAGSGTTVEAAVLEGFRCIAIEREADYLPLTLARIERNRTAEPDVAAAEALALFDLEEPA